jgi:hypothetical protein
MIKLKNGEIRTFLSKMKNGKNEGLNHFTTFGVVEFFKSPYFMRVVEMLP